MENLQRFQELVNSQKERKEKIESILENYHKPKFEIDFRKDNVIYLKIRDKSSVKFSVLQNKERIITEYNSLFPQDILKVI